MKRTLLLLAFALGAPAFASEPSVRTLAQHPECFISGDQVIVRGAVIVEGNGTPIEGAHVSLAYGNDTLHGITDSDGMYTATGLFSGAPTIRESRVLLPTPTGSLMPRPANAATASCHPVRVHVGTLQAVR